MGSCRLIVDPPASGTWNMAVDEALLAAAVDGDVATLRLYQWNEPTLSLGYFQRADDRNQHAASRACAVVRRQSGGGAILHDRELTYSLTLPPGHSLTRNATALYTAVHNAFIALLAPRLESAKVSNWRLTLNDKASRLGPSEEPFLCFQRRACGDLLLVAKHDFAKPTAGLPWYKILGSAQRRHRGAILQHGSLLVAQSPAAPELLGWNELTGESLPRDELAQRVVRQFFGLLGVDSASTALPEAIRGTARQIENDKYSSRSWTARR